MGRQRPAQGRIARAVAAVVVAILVVVVVPALVAGTPGWGASCAGAAPSPATINIGVVVDFGDLRPGDDPGRLRVTCVGVPAGTNGVAMLQAAGHGVRLDSSGLLCAIDGLPAAGCGERTATGYRYWAYFHGSGSSWAYSGIGPGGYRATAGTVEGWHFVEGAGNPTDPPPGRAPVDICPVAPPPAAPTTAPPSPTTVRPSAPTATTTPPAIGPTTAPGGPEARAVPSLPASTSTTTAAGPGAPAPSDTGVADDAASPGTTGVSPPLASSAPVGSVARADRAASDVTILAAAESPPGPGSAPTATIAAIVVVAAVGGAAAWRLRGRPGSTR